MSQAHRATAEKLHAYFGPQRPHVSLIAPHHRPRVESPTFDRDSDHSVPTSPSVTSLDTLDSLQILFISAEDGRDSLVDLTKTLAEMAQRDKLHPEDITMDLVDAEINESIMRGGMPEPDLLLLFGPRVELEGYPPWQIRLTEIL
jgi:undecaprenyl pyrophosphate synthase